ncbi:ATP-binding cassette domain-containing protein [Rathayibacter sp. VKM Ac-2803]|uniref:methionine ABC transporter ATP-binding protein n=1 Tax=unclassified Rathayibacter TaxID=2609250 RepID=UPI00135A82EC|nr:MULTISPECIES: ATP-binding cassette domain-containing protein [unclassified Rathayibacter]MWV48304.1 ATP-binding cassette domain-containing protein [Rathayibacter sp. VKM Ac-2803]MWV59203.1 ATP-binding cassette domain-containing protein [Rathayibacter sp. VKM Ac-2754]
MITATGLSKTFGGSRAVRALDDVSLHVEEGTIFGVVGQSGAGKSTLLRAINLLERPDAGTVEVGGVTLTDLDERALRRARHDIGMVFQHFNLLSNRTVQQNVEFALETIGVHGAERSRRAAEMLDLVGLSSLAGGFPAQLSGGQKQRVGIARALAGRPRVLLSDEATSALDPETTRSILDLLRSLNRELGLTVLLITHEMDVVKRICDSAALMESGRILEQGELVRLVSTPGSALARELFPLGPLPEDDGSAIIDITFSGGSADRPVIAQLARGYGMDVSILGAVIETIGGSQAGRTRLALPGDRGTVARAVEDLRSQGLTVDWLRGGPA